jgi:hypothetical protein
VTLIGSCGKPIRSVFRLIILLTFVFLYLFFIELVPDGQSFLEEGWVFLEFPFSSDFDVITLDGTSGGCLGSGAFLSFVVFCGH